MIDISLDPSLAVALPDFVVGVVEADSVTVTEHDA